MGLDMFLERTKRYKDATMRDVAKIDSLISYQQYAKETGNPHNYNLKDWCGDYAVDLPAQDVIDFYTSLRHCYYSDWDVKKEHPWYSISDEVAYWRKANAIHQWFVDNVQDGIDDCDYHHEVTEWKLRQLLETCKRVLREAVTVDGQVQNGTTYYPGGRVEHHYEPGRVVTNPAICNELLPTSRGCFFGTYEYDEWYLQDLESTVEQIERVLAETDFETEMVYYISSW